MRKLASIQKIWNIQPIEGADRIQLANVLGWQCVIRKDEFQINDKAVYFEIDSYLPIREQFEFMRPNSYKNTDLLGEGFRLRTMKFKGQISQGLLLPVYVFPELSEDMEIGTDVTELLGIRKWEIPETVTSGGTIIGTLPYDVPHTDETRIQTEPALLQWFAGLQYYISTKMDGISCSLSIDENGFHVTGHNFEYKDDGSSTFYNLVNSRAYKVTMQKYFEQNHLKTLTIQGEFCGPGIQKNKMKLWKPNWYVFTVRIDGKRIGLNQMLEICNTLGMETVPIEEVGDDLPSVYPTVESLLKRANGYYQCGNRKEGIVIRPTEPVYCPLISAALSMKVLNNNYLLSEE